MWEKVKEDLYNRESAKEGTKFISIQYIRFFSEFNIRTGTVAEIKVTSVLTVLACGGFKFIFSSV